MLDEIKEEHEERLVDKQKRIAEELEKFLEDTYPDTRRIPHQIARVTHHIHRHLFDPDLNVGRVRSACGIRNNNFSTRFRTRLGLGIREYIEAMRLRAAERLLQGSALEIYLVALAVGYDHQETFHRAFRRRFGCTPLEYRDLAVNRS